MTGGHSKYFPMKTSNLEQVLVLKSIIKFFETQYVWNVSVKVVPYFRDKDSDRMKYFKEQYSKQTQIDFSLKMK